jgi:PAS domain S-box-containing protein
MSQAQQVARLGSWAYRPPGVREHLSDEFLRMYGFDPAREHPTDQELFAMAHSEDRQRVEEEVAKLFKNGQVLDVKFRIIRPDGQLRAIRDRGVAVFENGVIVRFVGVCLDITEEEQRIDQLRLSEAFMAQAQQITKVGSFAYRSRGVTEHWSGEMFQIWGFDPSQGFPPSHQMMARVHPDDRSRVEEAAKQLFDHSRNFDLKFRYAHPDGKLRIIRDVCVPIIVDGVIQRFVGACMDMTEEEERINQLRLSEAFMAQAQQLARVGSWVYGPSGECEHWSEATFRIYGFEPAQKIPTFGNGNSLLHPDDRKRVAEEAAQLFENGQELDTKYRFIRADGQVRVIRDRGIAIRENGVITRFVGASLDITEEEQRIDRLQLSEAFMAQAQQLARVGSWACKDPTSCQHWSEEMFRIFGFDPAKGHPPNELLFSLIHPEDRQRLEECLTQFFKGGQVLDVKYRFTRPDGQLRTIHNFATQVFEGGDNIRFVGACVDVTEQEQLTQELRQKEFYLCEGQRLAHAGSWSFTLDGICDYWSQELYNILGFDPAKGIPTIADYLRLIHPQDRELVEGTINRMIAEGEACDLKKRIVRSDGGQRVIRCVGIPVREHGVVARFIGTLMDVTEQELLTHKLRRREVFLTEAQRLSHMGSFGWNVSTNEHFWSDETFRIFGYDTSTKITLQLILQRTHPQDVPLVQDILDGAISGGKDFDCEHRLLMSDGSVKHIRVVAHAVRGESGNVEFMGAVMDVTAQKFSQQALEKSLQETQALKNQFRLAIDTIPGMMWTSLPDGYIDFVNQRWLDYTGMTLEDACGSGWHAAVHPEDHCMSLL